MNKIVFNSPANKLTDAEKLVLYEKSWEAAIKLLDYTLAQAKAKIPEFTIPNEFWAPYEATFTDLVMKICDDKESELKQLVNEVEILIPLEL